MVLADEFNSWATQQRRRIFIAMQLKARSPGDLMGFYSQKFALTIIWPRSSTCFTGNTNCNG